MGLPDLVVPLREGKNNPQLLYALRSWAANLPHGRVWLVGFRPYWVGGVEHIPTVQQGTKFQNTTLAVRAACEHPEVSDPWILVNDDFFVMRPLPDGIPVYNRGPIPETESFYAARGGGPFLQGLREARELLVSLGHEAPLSYELHVPLVVGKRQMLNALETGPHLDVVKRTLYGNLAGLGGETIQDVKVAFRSPRFDQGSGFLSTMPDSFTNGEVGRLIRREFPDPCRYELGSIR
ncbi:hypothetical protein ACFY0N_00350 [Streptomyces vinaceus]|uniref:hypothetical protein n=1 Tax=Streptomyces vinaceus TaxID=1960 RepID=UPI00367602CA